MWYCYKTTRLYDWVTYCLWLVGPVIITLQQYGKRIKLSYGLIKHLNAYTSLSLYIQPNQDSFMLTKDNYTSDYFIYYNEKKYLLDNKKQDIKKDQKDLIGKSLDSKSVKNMLSRHIP